MPKKKKKQYDVDELMEDLTATVKSIVPNLPYDKVALSIIFTYAWWRAYGRSSLPTKQDVMLGITYALTIPPALMGGTGANLYAVGALEYLGIGLLIPDGLSKDVVKDYIQVIKDDFITTPLEYQFFGEKMVEIHKTWWEIFESRLNINPPDPTAVIGED